MEHTHIDWHIGTEWYKCMLIDYNLLSNWGNWQYLAGIGNNPCSPTRIFNPVKHAFDYDPQGEFVKAWVPELCGVTELSEIFQAWTMSEDSKAKLGLKGKDWVENPLLKIEFIVSCKGHNQGSRASPFPSHDSPFEIDTIPGQKVCCITQHWLYGQDMK
jgi:deoxyribodipyrimidine photo-lyase